MECWEQALASSIKQCMRHSAGKARMLLAEVPMRAIFRTTRVSPHKLNGCIRTIHSSHQMSGASSTAALYALSSSANTTQRVPDDHKELAHHAKGGTGFVNPWKSYKEMSGPSIMRAMIAYVPYHGSLH